MPSSSLSNTLPVTPYSMISGTDRTEGEHRVPHAMASIITSPNDSGQSTGNNRNCFGAPFHWLARTLRTRHRSALRRRRPWRQTPRLEVERQ